VKFSAAGNAASISTNEAATRPSVFGAPAGTGGGLIIGLAYEDVANNDVGIAQVYGYHESARMAALGGAVTIRLGVAMTYDLTTIGLNSVGADFTGPIVALDTIAGGAASGNAAKLSFAIDGIESYADHVFLRCL
jgi:hypothetical protein